MRVKTWKIIDRGGVPLSARMMPWTCACGTEAQLPIVGMPLAVTGSSERGDVAIVFDGSHALPKTIQCRKCGRVSTTN